jgi:hypothetical protein
MLRRSSSSSDTRILNFYFFVGRLNPPHVGHIDALQQMVNLSMATNTTPVPAIVFLGSGPRGERTLDNPITFEAKCLIVESKIPGARQTYEIHPRIKPEDQLIDIIKPRLVAGVKQVNIIQVAGGKDEDASKLNYIRSIVSDKLQKSFPAIEFGTAVVSIDPSSSKSGIAMSGTEVRKDAYLSLVNGSGFPSFQQKYNRFYGPHTARIYEEILFPTTAQGTGTGVALTREQLTDYIESNLLPFVATKSKGKKGGTKRKPRKRVFKRKTIARKRR